MEAVREREMVEPGYGARGAEPGRDSGLVPLAKAPTGIAGLDEVTEGGLPRGRPTLVCGGAGCGKTLFAMEFLVRGATQYGEPGVFVSFEENAEELTRNVASLGFDLETLVRDGMLALDHVRVERQEIEEAGEYDLEGLFLRLGYAIDSIGAKRVVLDTIEALFASLSQEGILRAELRRLFRWLKDRGVTAVITGERGEGALTRRGLEEYVSDCVILLDHRVQNQVSTRRLRVVKYRGSVHGTNEYPFLIDSAGFTVMPVTSLGLDHPALVERISTGIPSLDAMVEGGGFFRGSSILISGPAGSGKSSIAAHMVDAACRRGERVVLFAFEESPAQIVRNMRSIGLDLQTWVDRGLLHFHAARPTMYGLEMHLSIMQRLVTECCPTLVVVDPITNLLSTATPADVRATLVRLMDGLKGQGITAVFTSLTSASGSVEETDLGVSSLMDTWILVRFLEGNGERNRALYLLKSRGMAHSNQVREFVITSQGVDLVEVCIGPGGVLTGSARRARELEAEAERAAQREAAERRKREAERRRRAVEAQIAALRSRLECQEAELARTIAEGEEREAAGAAGRRMLTRLRLGAHPAGAETPMRDRDGGQSERTGTGAREGGER